MADPVEHLRMLVREHQGTGSIGKKYGAFLGVQQPLHSAVHNEVSGSQARDDGRVTGNGHRGARGTHRYWSPVRWRGHHHRRHCRADALESEHRYLDQLGPAVILGKHHRCLFARHRTADKVIRESLDPVPRNAHTGPHFPLVRSVVEPCPTQTVENNIDAPREHGGTATGIAVHPFQCART